MTIQNIQQQLGNPVGTLPQTWIIQTNDTTATVTAAGYLNSASKFGYQFTDGDLVQITTTDEPTAIYVISITNGIITLSANTNEFVHLPPVTDKNFVFFYGTEGVIQDLGISASDPSYVTVPMLNPSPTPTPGNLVSFSAANGTIKDSAVVANKVLVSSFATPDVNANTVRFDITVGQAVLAAGGSVTLYTSSGSKQYKISNLWVNSGGTNFSGGGGDRLLSITDNTTVYSVVPAASLQTLVNTGWGVTGLPFPASAAINTSTAAGASLVAKYSGGTTDYTAGSVVISGLMQRVA
jgi:hypothetical protein